jgi:hypothetical protein
LFFNNLGLLGIGKTLPKFRWTFAKKKIMFFLYYTWSVVPIIGMLQYLFKESHLCVISSSMRELLVCEAYGGGLHEHFYWPKMKKDLQRICDKCITCRKVKRTQPHGLCTPLHVPKEP